MIEPRVEELFSLVQQTIRESGYEEALSSGIVITGGSQPAAGNGGAGRGHFPEAGARGRAVLRRVRSPMWCARRRFATAMGLLEEARQIRLRGRKVAEQSGSFKDTMRRMKEWFLGNF